MKKIEVKAILLTSILSLSLVLVSCNKNDDAVVEPAVEIETISENSVSDNVVEEIISDNIVEDEVIIEVDAVIEAEGVSDSTVVDFVAGASTKFTSTQANIRSTPSATGTKIATLPINTSVSVLGTNKDGGWSKITFEGKDAWVKSSLLSATKVTITAPTVPADSNAIQLTPADEINQSPTPPATSGAIDEATGLPISGGAEPDWNVGGGGIVVQ